MDEATTTPLLTINDERLADILRETLALDLEGLYSMYVRPYDINTTIREVTVAVSIRRRAESSSWDKHNWSLDDFLRKILLKPEPSTRNNFILAALESIIKFETARKAGEEYPDCWFSYESGEPFPKEWE